MRKTSLLLAAGVVALAASAPAQVNFTILFDRLDIETARQDPGGNAEVDGVAVNADGSAVYTFDSDGGFDGVFRYTPANDNGADGAGLSILTIDTFFGGTADTSNAAPYGFAASGTDITTSADGTVYQIVRDGTPQNIIRINQTTSPITIEQVASNTLTTGAEVIVADDARGVLWFATNDTFNSGTAENLYSVDLAATGGAGVPVMRVSEATMNAVVIPTPSVGGSAAIGEIEPYDMTLHPDGDLLISMSFNESNLGDGLRVPIIDAVGCILKVTPDMGAGGGAGAATLWLSRAEVLSPVEAGGTPRSFPAIQQLVLETAPNGRILIGNQAFAGDLDQSFSWASADASVHRLIADNLVFRADADIAAVAAGVGDLGFETRGIAVDGNGDVYMADQFGFPGSNDQMIKVTGIDYELSNVNDWIEF